MCWKWMAQSRSWKDWRLGKCPGLVEERSKRTTSEADIMGRGECGKRIQISRSSRITVTNIAVEVEEILLFLSFFFFKIKEGETLSSFFLFFPFFFLSLTHFHYMWWSKLLLSVPKSWQVSSWLLDFLVLRWSKLSFSLSAVNHLAIPASTGNFLVPSCSAGQAVWIYLWYGGGTACPCGCPFYREIMRAIISKEKEVNVGAR